LELGERRGKEMEEWEKRADLVEAEAATVTVGAAEGEVEDKEEAMKLKLKLKQVSFDWCRIDEI